MAIKVQVKGDQKFDNSFADSTRCNGTYINDAFGVNPYTTTTLDGTFGTSFVGSQVPASLVSLCGSNGFQPMFTGFNPMIGSTGTQVPFASTVNPFATANSFGVNPFAPAFNAFGQAVSTVNPAYASAAGVAPFQGWTVPATSDFVSTTTPSYNGFGVQAPSSFTGMTPVWSSLQPTSGVSPFALQAQQYAAAATLPRVKSQQDTTWSVNPMTGAWTGSTTPLGMIDPSLAINNGSSIVPTPWSNGIATGPLAASVAQRSTMSSYVPVDIYENEDEYILLADMPGASIEDVDILVEAQSLVIKGLIKPMNWEKAGMGLNTVSLLQEKPAIKNIERVFPLGSNVLTDKLTAKLIDGILTIKLPKVKVGCASAHRVAVATA